MAGFCGIMYNLLYAKEYPHNGAIKMSLLELSIISSAGIKAIAFGIYAYLYWQYRQRFLGAWTLAWGLILLKSIADPFVLKVGQSIPVFVIFQSSVVLSVLLLTWGTWNFVGKKLPKLWIYTTIALTLISITGALLQWSALRSLIPTIIIYGLIYIHTGLILLRNLETQGLGKKITAYAFIINGIHQLDFPLFRPTDLAPWGYLFDSFLRLVISVGFLLTYFEKTKYDLTKREEQFRLLAENAKDIIYRYKLLPCPRFEYISPAVADITGYTPEEYYADPDLIYKIIHPDDRPLLQRPSQPHLTKTPISLRLLHKNQEQLWVEQHVVSICDHDGKLTAFEGIIRDVTARKQLEQELFRLDRLNIVGQMAANIGHEIRNPLTTVRGFLQVLARKKELTPYQDNFGVMLDELDRANSLITEYLSLSKHRLTDLKPQNLNKIIESLYPLLQAHANNSNQLIILELEDSPELLLDQKEIRQLILNLARNGLEAMPPGKTLTIRTYVEADATVLAIRDEGGGIPAAILEKIGLPFFTTKESGTGLGLAICYSIANRHQARIDIETTPNGTTFLVGFKPFN